MPPEKKPVADEAQVSADAAATAVAEAPAPAGNDAAEAAPAADPAEGAPEIPKGVAVVKHPDDPKAGASFRGAVFEADERGFLVVPLDAVNELVSHGFVMVKEG